MAAARLRRRPRTSGQLRVAARTLSRTAWPCQRQPTGCLTATSSPSTTTSACSYRTTRCRPSFCSYSRQRVSKSACRAINRYIRGQCSLPGIASDLLEFDPSSDHTDRPNQMTRPTTWIVERSEEHTSELQPLMRITYAVFCLKKKKYLITIKHTTTT